MTNVDAVHCDKCDWLGDDTLVDWSLALCPQCRTTLTSNNGQAVPKETNVPLQPTDVSPAVVDPSVPPFGVSFNALDLTLPDVKQLLEVLTQQLQTHHELYLSAIRRRDELEEEYQSHRSAFVLTVGEEEGQKAGTTSSKPDRALMSDERAAKVDLLIEDAVRDRLGKPVEFLRQRRQAQDRVDQLAVILKHLTTQFEILRNVAMIELGIRKHAGLDGTP